MINSEVLTDLEKLRKIFEFKNQLKNKTVLITGGTGLIGSLTLEFLCLLNDKEDMRINIIGMARNKKKVKSLNLNIKWIIQDLKEEITINEKVDYVIHTASPTQSSFLSQKPVETIKDTFFGAINLLDYSMKNKVKSFIYLSSIEVYGVSNGDVIVDESYSGYLDSLNPRSGYPIGKRLIECLCSSYLHEYGLDTKIIRLTQTFGAGIALDDNRVFAQFSRSVIEKKDIILHTKGDSSKGYIYTTDAINAIFFVLFKGKAGEAYNVANKVTYISIKNMANLLINEFNNELKIKIDIDNSKGYAPSSKINLDTKKLTQLGWVPQYNLIDMYKRTICYLNSFDN